MIVAFQKQMTQHWVKLAKIIRELISKKAGGGALYSFLSFLISTNLPISLIIQPWIVAKVYSTFYVCTLFMWHTDNDTMRWKRMFINICFFQLNQRAANESEAHWQAEILELIQPVGGRSTILVDKGTHYFLGQLAMELRTMKEEFSSRMLGNFLL